MLITRLKQANQIIMSGKLRKARGMEIKYGRLLMKLPAENVSLYPTCIVSDGVHYTTPKSIATVLNEYFVQIGQFLADKLPTSSAAQTLQGSFANCSQFKLSLIDESFIAKRISQSAWIKSVPGCLKMPAQQ